MAPLSAGEGLGGEVTRLPYFAPSKSSPPMIRCLAVDDEAPALLILADYIGQLPFLTLVGTTTNPIEALTMVQQGLVDLVFLDIQMPQLTGLQFLELAGNKCKVILTTAYPEYALEGYENDVVDYLLKPISFERFFKAAQKALALLPGPVPAPVAAPVLVAASVVPATLSAAGHMFVKGESKNKYLRVNHADILYIEGLSNYVSIQLPTHRYLPNPAGVGRDAAAAAVSAGAQVLHRVAG